MYLGFDPLRSNNGAIQVNDLRHLRQSQTCIEGESKRTN